MKVFKRRKRETEKGHWKDNNSNRMKEKDWYFWVKTELVFYTLLDNSKLEQVLMFFAYTHAMGSSVRALSNKLAYLFSKDNRFDDCEVKKRKRNSIHYF